MFYNFGQRCRLLKLVSYFISIAFVNLNGYKKEFIKKRKQVHITDESFWLSWLLLKNNLWLLRTVPLLHLTCFFLSTKCSTHSVVRHCQLLDPFLIEPLQDDRVYNEQNLLSAKKNENVLNLKLLFLIMIMMKVFK